MSLISHVSDFTPNSIQKNDNGLSYQLAINIECHKLVVEGGLLRQWLLELYGNGKQSSTVAKANGKIGVAAVSK
jgi:hypothetical protein